MGSDPTQREKKIQLRPEMTAAFFWKMLPTEEESIFVWEVSGKDKIHLLHAGLSFKQKIPFFRTFLISSEKREREREREGKNCFLKIKEKKRKERGKNELMKKICFVSDEPENALLH